MADLSPQKVDAPKAVAKTTMDSAEACLQACIASRFEIHFVTAYKGTLRAPKKRYERIEKLSTWFTQHSGNVSGLAPPFWVETQAVMAAGAPK